ncbi:Rossmann-like and DUF2520 domain-containing protein [Dysgonomonas sp. 511]|uniref:Rossmann-like and DUF2520 domain-containing protein n=1 Tax=Dysgonomonas sp. 511 TaxID=2302930 RepID=UPI0013D767B7|nr:Rossmann-like and DUF2520 domain-containing protein [Dysgonomonas sp. 511]NDV77729.1 DUF2520 domain-containing protein [Dysgonomonas sp. 511]
MKVVLIGAGNVATQLGRALYSKSFDIVQVYSRTETSASLLAKEIGAIAITDISKIAIDADFYIFSLKDSVLEDVLKQVPENNGIWIHTAGSLPLDIFCPYTSRCGVLYPFQTFSKNREICWAEIPLFVEASDEAVLSEIRNMADKLSGKVYPLSSEKRKYVHLTGVFACNFSNHMYTLSKLFLAKVGLPFDVALPLIDETANKVHTLSPEEAQTGPAVRYDENIIHKHLDLIEDEQIKKIYALLSESIHKMNK